MGAQSMKLHKLYSFLELNHDVIESELDIDEERKQHVLTSLKQLLDEVEYWRDCDIQDAGSERSEYADESTHNHLKSEVK
jgi:hypothetical protein